MKAIEGRQKPGDFRRQNSIAVMGAERSTENLWGT
jgi:hypothetical protein